MTVWQELIGKTDILQNLKLYAVIFRFKNNYNDAYESVFNSKLNEYWLCT